MKVAFAKGMVISAHGHPLSEVGVKLDFVHERFQSLCTISQSSHGIFSALLYRSALSYYFTVVYFRKESDLSFKEASGCGSKNTQCDIRNLTYYTTHLVKVDTVLRDEFGPESDTAKFKIPSGSKF